MNNSTTDTTSPEDAGGIPLSRILVGVLLFFIILVTVVGNTLVLVAVAREKRLHTVFNILIVNLAITDVSVGLVAMTFFAAFNILQEWPFGEFLCGLWIFFDFGMTFASIFTLLAISLDRYWSVLWSNHYRIHHNRRMAIIATVTIWVSMLVLWVPPFTVDRINNSREGECFYDPAKNQVFVIVVAVVGYHGSTVVMLFCYIKVFLTLSYIMVGYLICWMPFHVSFDIMAIDRSLVSEKFYEVTYWLAYCNSAINPFLYNFSSSEFNRAFKKLIGRR
nr:hypothetical protein BaRGS_000828 [Batillaria attramentaria]KAG5695637.1 hypothetical protein BaRGS_029127 [Batillaria attramentaria]